MLDAVPINPIAEKKEATMETNNGNHGTDLLASKYSFDDNIFRCL